MIIAFFITEIDFEASEEEEIEPLGKRFTAWEIVRSLFALKNFWRYITLITMTIGSRFAYRMLDSTLPKYMERTLGEGSLYGTVLMANALSALLWIPMMTPLVHIFTNYTLVIIACIII